MPGGGFDSGEQSMRKAMFSSSWFKHARNTTAAERFFSRLVKQFGSPRVVMTDKLGSYVKPIQTIAPNADQRAHKGLNNRVENSHHLCRKREKIMGQFKSPRQAQHLLSACDQINTIFCPHRII